MSYKRFNLNYHCRIKLNESGARAWNAAHSHRDPVHAGDTVRMQMWDAMNVLGPLLVMGPPPPCDMTVELEDGGFDLTPPEDAT